MPWNILVRTLCASTRPNTHLQITMGWAQDRSAGFTMRFGPWNYTRSFKQNQQTSILKGSSYYEPKKCSIIREMPQNYITLPYYMCMKFDSCKWVPFNDPCLKVFYIIFHQPEDISTNLKVTPLIFLMFNLLNYRCFLSFMCCIVLLTATFPKNVNPGKRDESDPFAAGNRAGNASSISTSLQYLSFNGLWSGPTNVWTQKRLLPLTS